MRFTIDSNDYNNMVKRIKSAVAKKASIPVAMMVLIQADAGKNEITMSAVNFTGKGIHATIRSSRYVSVQESGNALVNIDNLEKTAIVKSNDLFIEFDSESEKFRMKSAKKGIAVHAIADDDLFQKTPDESADLICNISGNELLEKMAGIACCIEKGSNNTMLDAFCFDFLKSRIIALDGHRIGIARLSDDCQLPDNPYDLEHKECIIESSALTILKGIAGKLNDDDRIAISAGKDYTRFAGKDFDICIRKVDGKYFDVERMTFESGEYKYTVDAKELGTIAGEYAKYVKGEKLPMILAEMDGNIYTYCRTGVLETSDCIESAELDYIGEADLCAGFDPVFISDACKTIGGKADIIGKNRKAPIEISNDDYMFLILPVNIGEHDPEMYRQNIGKLIAA